MLGFPETLVTGHQDFLASRFTRETARYKALAGPGQAPDTLVIACCDSRVTPEIIFDAAPGDLFVVRNVANLIPPCEPDGAYHATSAAIEFAVQSLKVGNIVVLGHGGCGGIRAALDTASSPLSPGDFIGKWMNLLAPAANTVLAEPTLRDCERQTALERISIRCSIENLRTFPCVEALERQGRLGLHGAWFDISSGAMWLMDMHTGRFEQSISDRAKSSGKTKL
ncbi:carbonic anhydrase [Mesorhizobium sp. 1B3]|uniref:carbonic anhydrase n=1 Tax=Mesorhizobium sp. 1B3 TaxID=3243599 RepID=UPI003D98EE4C